MAAVSHSPLGAEFFLDTRGDARSLRVRWHDRDGLVLLSLWRGAECTGTFRLSVDEVPTLIEQRLYALAKTVNEAMKGARQ